MPDLSNEPPEVVQRALLLLGERVDLDQAVGGHPAINWALQEASERIRKEEEEKRFDLELIEAELSEGLRKRGTYPACVVERLLEAARNYYEKATAFDQMRDDSKFAEAKV